jgi:hypothetical protein
MLAINIFSSDDGSARVKTPGAHEPFVRKDARRVERWGLLLVMVPLDYRLGRGRIPRCPSQIVDALVHRLAGGNGFLASIRGSTGRGLSPKPPPG